MFVFFKFLLPVFLPFIISWIIALLLQPVVSKLVKAKIPRRPASALLVIIAVALFGLVCWLALSRLYNELSQFTSDAASFVSKAWSDDEFAGKIIEKIDTSLPFFRSRTFLENAWKSLGEKFDSSAGSIITSLTTRILPILGDVVSFVPDAIMYIFVFSLSCYYFTVDFDRINRSLVRVVPANTKKLLSRAKTGLKTTLGGLLRAYAIIILITFTELFISLSLIGVRYSLVISLVTSLVDILPVLGTGTVLIPWGIFTLVFGTTSKGIALLVTYFVITVVRELIEPKIVGKTMGIHPLLTLVSMYAGLKFFGIIGLVLMPPLVTFAKNLFSSTLKS